MTDRPILFSAPMIRALLDGSKTQTRRVLNPQPFIDGCNNLCAPDRNGKIWNYGQSACGTPHLLNYAITNKKIKKGDRLWARENWQGLSYGDYEVTKNSQCEVRYAATDPLADLSTADRGYPYRPSIHMPRWASRLTLTVADVRVQRLQDISEADAIAEGIEDVTSQVAASDPTLRFWRRYRDGGWNGYVDCAVASYASLWTEINGAGAWEANPWIVAYSFKVHLGNIDQMEKANG